MTAYTDTLTDMAATKNLVRDFKCFLLAKNFDTQLETDKASQRAVAITTALGISQDNLVNEISTVLNRNQTLSGAYLSQVELGIEVQVLVNTQRAVDRKDHIVIGTFRESEKKELRDLLLDVALLSTVEDWQERFTLARSKLPDADLNFPKLTDGDLKIVDLFKQIEQLFASDTSRATTTDLVSLAQKFNVELKSKSLDRIAKKRTGKLVTMKDFFEGDAYKLFPPLEPEKAMEQIYDAYDSLMREYFHVFIDPFLTT